MTETPPPVDHLVLPVADLATSRDRYAALGFTVAPEGVHPFGTVNACVYLADGTFLEPLAIGDNRSAAAAIAEGNVFVGRDALYRQANGDKGLSAVVLGTDNAGADDRAFHDRAISAGDMLEFSRAFVAPDGRSDTASFRLAFAAMHDAPDAFFFSCQRVNVPHVDRSSLEAHANTASRLDAVLVSSDDPNAARRFLERFLGFAGPVEVSASNASLVVRTPAQLAAQFGMDTPRPSPLRLTGIVFRVADIAATKTVLDRNAIPFRRHTGRIVVDPAAGQGVPFLFEAP